MVAGSSTCRASVAISTPVRVFTSSRQSCGRGFSTAQRCQVSAGLANQLAQRWVVWLASERSQRLRPLSSMRAIRRAVQTCMKVVQSCAGSGP
jgi:hypothetical protein